MWIALRRLVLLSTDCLFFRTTRYSFFLKVRFFNLKVRHSLIMNSYDFDNPGKGSSKKAPKIKIFLRASWREPTWDGGGAHANSRWNEELVRTERESERERVLYSRTVWHGERETESLARYFNLKNRSHWEVPVFEGKPSTSWRDPIIPILL